MGRRTRAVFLSLCLLLGACGKETNPAEGSASENTGPRKEAEDFTWSRSIRDREAGILRTQWTLAGRQALQLEQTGTEGLLQIADPFITYFPSPGAAGGKVTILAPRAGFEEKADRITFEPAALIQTYDTAAEPDTSLVSAGLVYDGHTGTVTAPGEITLMAADMEIDGRDLVYELEKGLLTIAAQADIRIIRRLSPQNVLDLPSSIPPETRDFLGFVEYERRMAAGGDVYRISNPGRTLVNLQQRTIDLAGPVNMESSAFSISTAAMHAEAVESSPAFAETRPVISLLRAEGNVRFQEHAGEKRTVTCARLIYTLSDQAAVMTGSPVLTGPATEISSHRITYHVQKEEFIFAKPFQVRHLPQDPEKVTPDE